jgi:hypothetical protein
VGYRSGDDGREAEEREKRERARADEARFAAALREWKLWTPALARVVRWSAFVAVGVTLVFVLVAVGRRVHRRSLPCGGDYARCIDATHLELCDGYGPPRVARCTPCDDRGCTPPNPPMAGDACRICDPEEEGIRARPEGERCAADGRAVLACSGCFSVWTIGQTCSADQTCVMDAGIAGCQR